MTTEAKIGKWTITGWKATALAIWVMTCAVVGMIVIAILLLSIVYNIFNY